MTAPDARQSDELREALADVLRRHHGQPSHPVEQYHREADAILPVVTAWAEAQARARAAEELRKAAEWAFDRNDGYGSFSSVIDHLDARADALAADDRTDPA